MSSNNLSLADYSLFDTSSETLSNKETQTSFTRITDSFDLVKGPSRPLPKGIDNTEAESTLKNTLDCRVINDPSDFKSNELIIDSFNKDIVNTDQTATITEVSGSPESLKYCKEVAKSYLKTYLSDCEDHVKSLEKLIKDALEDIPDSQPCFEAYVGERDIQDSVYDTSNGEMDSTPNNIDNQKEKTTLRSSSTNEMSDNTDDLSTPKSAPTKVNIVKSDSHLNVDSVREQDTNDLNKNVELERSSSVESITKCIKDSFTALKESASIYLDKADIVMDLKNLKKPDEKPTFYAEEKSEADVDEQHSALNVQTEKNENLDISKSLLNSSTEKMTTFKDTCKNFAENLINTSNEKIYAVKDTCKEFAQNLVNNSSEKICSAKDSCKDIAEIVVNSSNEKICTLKETCKDFAENLVNNSNEKLNTMKDTYNDLTEKLVNSYNEMEGTCKDYTESLLNTSDEKIHNIKNTCKDYADKFYNTSKNTVKLLTSESTSILPKTKNDDPPEDKAITSSSGVTDIISSSLGINFSKLRDDIITSRFEKSSPYDVPLPKDPVTTPSNRPERRIPTVKAIDHTPDPPAASNVFEMIRSKIFSIFRDEGEISTEPVIQEIENDDEDEDPFERFIEQ